MLLTWADRDEHVVGLLHVVLFGALHSQAKGLSEGGDELLTRGGREGHESRTDWLSLSGSEN